MPPDHNTGEGLRRPSPDSTPSALRRFAPRSGPSVPPSSCPPLQKSWLRAWWSYLAPFLRYGDLLAKNCLFFVLPSQSAPSLPTLPLEFCVEVNRQETRVMWLSFSEDRNDRSWSRFGMIPACDGQTVRQIVIESIIANTARCKKN